MKNKLLASILTACMLLTMLPTAAFAAEAEAEPGTEQTATATEQSDPVTEDAGNQTEGEGDGTDAGDAASGQTAENSVAEVGGEYYATLAEAIEAAQGGETVTLLKDASGDGIQVQADDNFTLDLGENTYTITKGVGSPGTETNAMQLLKGAKVIIKNGTLSSSTSKIGIKNYCDLTIENVKINSMSSSNPIINNCGKLTINGEQTELTANNTKWAITTGNYNKGDIIETTINDGNISSVACETPLWETGGATVAESVTTTIKGGTIGRLGVYDWRPEYGDNYADAPLLTNWNMFVENGTVGELVFDEQSVGKVAISGGTFSDVNCLNYLSAGADVDVVLDKDVTADVTIPADTTVTLDLNGKTLKNSLEDTITVEYGASLTIQGDGTVDNTSHARAAIYNNGTVVLNGGQYTRSQETGKDPETSGENSYYNILNHGSMTINDGVTVSQSGGFSSMIANGYYNYTDKNPRNGHVEGTNHANPELVITGGTFSGGLNTVKNDDGAKLTIVDGTFENTKQAAVMNWNEATIKGGSFSVQESAGSVLVNGSYGANTVDRGILTIEGGTFTIPGGNPIISINQSGVPAEAETTVKGGSYSSSVAEYADPNLNFEAKDSNGIYTYHSNVNDALDAAGSDGTVSTTEENLGLEITLPTPTKEGYTFLYWEAKDGTQYKGGQTVKASVFQDLTAVWKKNSDSSSGSSDNERTYAIVTEDDGHGSVTVSADEASAGTRITVTVKPDAGYELDELTVTDAKNKDLKVTKRSETTYTFHMADSKVTVEASFTKDGTVQKPDTRFDDVAKSAWYYKAVEYVAENGIMSGVSAREFAPNAGFSRAMLAQTLYAMSGKPTVKAEGTFADVAANAWYADAVNWAAEKGYVSGVGDGKFAPDASITREQMALILYRYAGSPDASGMVLREFADGDSVSAYAVDAIRWAVHEGLISGMENNTLAPQGTATRAQVAQILMNFHQKLDK